MNPVADEEAEAHGGERGGAEEEGVEGELVHRGIADRARDAQGHEHGGEGGAEGLLVRAARIEVHREEDRGHRAEEGADGAGEEARSRAERGGRNGRGAAGRPGRHPQGIDRVQDDEGAERSSEDDCVEGLEEEQAGRDAEGASGQEPEELALRDVPAVAADDRGGGDDAHQGPGGRKDLHRDDEREERQADRAAEAEAAAQREGEEEHRHAVGELEGREVLDQERSLLRGQLGSAAASPWTQFTGCGAAGPGKSGRCSAPRVRGRPHQVVEDLALHALDLQPVAGTKRRPFLGPRGAAQVLEQALELRHALPRECKLLVGADHATSNMPRTVPSRLVCQPRRNSCTAASWSIPSLSQKTLAPSRASASACGNKVRDSRGQSSSLKSSPMTSTTSTSRGSGTADTKLPNHPPSDMYARRQVTAVIQKRQHVVRRRHARISPVRVG